MIDTGKHTKAFVVCKSVVVSRHDGWCRMRGLQDSLSNVVTGRFAASEPLPNPALSPLYVLKS